MKFEEALKLMENEESVRRDAWCNPDHHLRMRDDGSIVQSWHVCHGELLAEELRAEDVLADDWSLYEPPPKPRYVFAETAETPPRPDGWGEFHLVQDGRVTIVMRKPSLAGMYSVAVSDGRLHAAEYYPVSFSVCERRPFTLDADVLQRASWLMEQLKRVSESAEDAPHVVPPIQDEVTGEGGGTDDSDSTSDG